MTNDTPVYDALAFNTSTVRYDIWVGTGTREALSKRGLKPDLATLAYCPREWLTDGFRSKDTPPPA